MLIPTTLPSTSTKRTATIAGVDGRIRLDVDHPVVRPQLPRNGTDHSHAHRIFQTQGTSESQDELSLTNLFRIREEIQGRQVLAIDLHESKVGLQIDSDHRTGKPPSTRSDHAPSRRSFNERQLHLNFGCASDYVCVGDDEAVGADDYSRTRRRTESDGRTTRTHTSVGVALDLHDSRSDARGQPRNRCVEFSESVLGCGVGREQSKTSVGNRARQTRGQSNAAKKPAPGRAIRLRSRTRSSRSYQNLCRPHHLHHRRLHRRCARFSVRESVRSAGGRPRKPSCRPGAAA